MTCRALVSASALGRTRRQEKLEDEESRGARGEGLGGVGLLLGRGLGGVAYAANYRHQHERTINGGMWRMRKRMIRLGSSVC